jgi:hypothetical protein
VWTKKAGSGCVSGNCGNRVYKKKCLIKRVCITECPTTKCVAVTVPASEAGHGVIQVQPAAPCVETIPVQPMLVPKR